MATATCLENLRREPGPLDPRQDKRVVVFGSSIPEKALETVRMLRKARDEFHGGPARGSSRAGCARGEAGVFRNRRTEYFDRRIG